MFFENLNLVQHKGIDMGLTTEQVKTPNFGSHTIDAMQNGFSFEEVKNCTTFDDIRALYHSYHPDYYWV
ncbi:MAG: hypothetical protein AMJ43_03915 [Coxiella sp. DG_40]|nr:MAG: hypothetical protein AMJ43_03915 [Coxiella sp. DG_40]